LPQLFGGGGVFRILRIVLGASVRLLLARTFARQEVVSKIRMENRNHKITVKIV
jgi:hypothetical protein